MHQPWHVIHMVSQVYDIRIGIKRFFKFTGEFSRVSLDVPHAAVEDHQTAGLCFLRALRCRCFLFTLPEDQVLYMTSYVGAYCFDVSDA